MGNMKALVLDGARYREAEPGDTICDGTGSGLGGAGGGPVDWTSVQNKPATYPATAHTHSEADVTGLTAALAGKAATAHTHPDAWTTVKLANDFTTSSATAVDVTGLAFTPAPNTDYEFEALLLTRTATATVGPRPGLGWPTGGTDGVATIQQTSSATANVVANGNIAAAVLAPVGGLPNTTQSFPATLWGTFRAGANPSGAVQVRLASETAGTVVTVKAGSLLKYRVL